MMHELAKRPDINPFEYQEDALCCPRPFNSTDTFYVFLNTGTHKKIRKHKTQNAVVLDSKNGHSESEENFRRGIWQYNRIALFALTIACALPSSSVGLLIDIRRYN